jgi:hypothetical protein
MQTAKKGRGIVEGERNGRGRGIVEGKRNRRREVEW